MAKQKGSLDFKLMSWYFMLRDIFHPPKEILAESGVKSGMQVLDFGCGPGSYSLAAAEMVGDKGKVYALDINPVAVQRVQKVAEKRKLKNVEAILSDCATGLPDGSVDLVLLLDTFHELEKPQAVLAELHRVLKSDGVLSFNDHHLEKEGGVVSHITGGGLFRLSNKGERVYNFARVE
jgi:ubiquinone/menaquinone biosynthesis C-methylase UbiE